MIAVAVTPRFCGKPHRLEDGKPVGHACWVLEPGLLEEESKGVHRGVDPRRVPHLEHRGLSPQGEGAPLTHHDLCKIGGLWLQRTQKCPLVLIDHQSLRTQEQPDVLGWRYGGRTSYLIEVKTSRGDFLKDSKKPFRAPGLGMGMLRYFLVPEALVKIEDLPEGWGLLYYKTSRRIEVRKEAVFRQLDPSGRSEEKAILCGMLERVASGWPTPSLLPRRSKEVKKGGPPDTSSPASVPALQEPLPLLPQEGGKEPL